MIAKVLITPLAMVGGVFYSVDRLPEPWETLTDFNRIFYLVDATRYGYTGLQDTSVWAALTWPRWWPSARPCLPSRSFAAAGG